MSREPQTLAPPAVSGLRLDGEMASDFTRWTRCDLTSRPARDHVLELSRRLLPHARSGALFFDLEWRLGQDPDWSSVWAYLYEGTGQTQGFAPFFRQDRPLPFHFGEFKIGSARLTRYTLIGEPLVLHAGSADEEGIKRALLLDVLGRLGPGEAAYFEGLALDSPTYKALSSCVEVARRFVTVQLGEPFEHQYIRFPDTYAEYLKAMGSRSRQSVQYSERKLARDMEGAVQMRCFEAIDDVDRFLEDAAAVSAKTYQTHLLGLGIRQSDEFRQRFALAAQRRLFRSYILYCNDHPVAFMVGYQHEGCFYYIDVGYDPAYAQWSVGSVLQIKVLRDLYERAPHPTLFDFSTGFGAHKARFGNVSRLEVNVLVLPATLRNRILVSTHAIVERASNSIVGLVDRLGLKARLKKLIRRRSSRGAEPSESNAPDR
jgi:hypothetical protein